jgi:hypothetical protein
VHSSTFRSIVGNTVRMTICYGPVVLLAASVSLNVALAQKLRDAAAPCDRLSPGRLIGLTRLSGEDGRGIDLVDVAGGRHTILYYFSPTCVWCVRDWPVIIALEHQVRSRFRFVAISTARSGNDPRVPASIRAAIHGVEERDRRLLGFTGTPSMVVVSPEGRIQRAWVGAFTDGIRRELERYFSIALPPLVEAPVPDGTQTRTAGGSN